MSKNEFYYEILKYGEIILKVKEIWRYDIPYEYYTPQKYLDEVNEKYPEFTDDLIIESLENANKTNLAAMAAEKRMEWAEKNEIYHKST